MRYTKNKVPLLTMQVEPPHMADGGDYFYRTHAPGIAMAQEAGIFVVNTTNINRQKDIMMREADILILKNICDPDILPLIRERKSRGRLTVYEIADDLNALQPWNPVYFFFKNRENLALVHHLAGCCDALQVTVPELKRIYGHLNQNCVVFPNQIFHVPPERPVRKGNEIVIGWGGSHGHLEDLAEIVGPLTNWIKTQANVSLHLMCSEPIWALFDLLPEHKKRRTSPGTIYDYYDFLTGIDIGIAPLKNTPFNRSRSDVKFLEYAVSGVVPVVGDLEPYRDSIEIGKTGFLFEDTVELLDILSHLAANASLLQAISRSSRQYVLKERVQSQHRRERINFYEGLLEEIGGQNQEIGRAYKYFEEWSHLKGAVREGRHLRLRSTRFENLLHDGLVIMQTRDDKELAREFFDEAAKLETKNYLPFLFGSSVSSDPIGSLFKTLELKPDSIKSWTLLGEEFARQGKIREALESFASALRIYPHYEIPYLRATVLQKRLKEQSRTERFSEKGG